MAASTPDTPATPSGPPVVVQPTGPHPSYIEVAKPYLFEHQIQDYRTKTGVSASKEDDLRIKGVTWTESTRKSLGLPVRTLNTAVIYYHRFRLSHSDHEYIYNDAAAAALLTACKIEDTLKRSKEILCAAHNNRPSTTETVTQDDPMFEAPSRNIVGVERLMLESSSFDFRSHGPPRLLIKLCRSLNIDQQTVGITAYNILLDLNRTWATLKQTSITNAVASLELAMRLHKTDIEEPETLVDYNAWFTTRAEVMETLLDVLDLYTDYQKETTVGPLYHLDDFIAIRIGLNKEATTKSLPRFTNALPTPAKEALNGNGSAPAKGGYQNGHKGKRHKGRSFSPTSPAEAATPSNERSNAPQDVAARTRAGMRDGTVRFMLDSQRAKAEEATVKRYFVDEMEDYEVEMEEERTSNPTHAHEGRPRPRGDSSQHHHPHPHGGHNRGHAHREWDRDRPRPPKDRRK